MPRRYTFVTIGFEGDAGLLHLQARSIRLYCPPDLIEEIIIVDNSATDTPKWQRSLISQYGRLADAVRFIPSADISPIAQGTHGWFSQQILKIKVADAVRTDRYLLLDAKNHLIANLDRSFIETAAGLARTCCHSYASHDLLEYLKATLQYLGVDPEAHLESFPRTHPPFTMYTHEARELVRQIEEKENKPFASVFMDRKLSEFFLYSGALISKGSLYSLYDMTQPGDAQIWPDQADANGCRKAILQAKRTGCPFMLVHRRALKQMDRAARLLLAEFWYQRNLFASVNDGMRFLRHPNRSYQCPNGSVVSWPLSIVAGSFGRDRRVLQL